MKNISLKFWKKIEGGKKSHYIFTQEDIFFVLTDMDEGDRGNFHAISLEEINRVRNQLCSNLIPKTFQCSRVFNFISEIKKKEVGSIKNKEMKERFFIDRLTRICYILTGMNLLKMEKRSGSVFFDKTLELNQIIKINHKSENLENQYIYTKENLSNNKPIKIEPVRNKLKPFRRNKLKLKKPFEKCPYCHFDVHSSKYEKHIKLKCPKRPK